MPGPLLYQLLKTKSKYPLHAAVKLMREDVVFLYLVENNAEVSQTKRNNNLHTLYYFGPTNSQFNNKRKKKRNKSMTKLLQ